MWRGKRLVYVEVHYIDAHVAGARLAQNRVHVGAIHVNQRANLVRHFAQRLNLRLENAQSVRIGNHHRRDIFAQGGAHRTQIDVAARVGRDVRHLETAAAGARRIGSVRRIGDDDAISSTRLSILSSAAFVIFADHQQPAKLALRARHRLHCRVMQSGNFRQNALRLEQHFEPALNARCALQRMNLRETRQRRNRFVQLRVVFHGAGTQRIKLGVDAEVLLRQPGEMAHQSVFVYGWQRQIAAHQVLEIGARHVTWRQIVAGLAFVRQLKEKRFTHNLFDDK